MSCLIWCDQLAGRIFSAFMLSSQNIDLKSVSCYEGILCRWLPGGAGTRGDLRRPEDIRHIWPSFSAPLVFPDNGDTKDDGDNWEMKRPQIGLDDSDAGFGADTDGELFSSDNGDEESLPFDDELIGLAKMRVKRRRVILEKFPVWQLSTWQSADCSLIDTAPLILTWSWWWRRMIMMPLSKVH